jgi:hypothetical protein
MKSRLALATCGTALAVSLLSTPARATCPQAEERLVFLDDTLTAEASRARTWMIGWSVGLAALTATQLTAIFFAEPADRVDWGVGAAFSGAGILPILALPPGVIADAKYIHGLTKDVRWDRCRVLAAAERALEKGASDEADARGILMHAGNVFYNGAQFLVMGTAFGHWESGAINAAIGLAIGEGLILTTPNSLGDALVAYRKGEFHAARPAPSMGLALKPLAVRGGAGLELGIRF